MSDDFVPPTPEWIRQNAESGYCPKGTGKIRYVNRDPLRIDRLLRKELITGPQHGAALRLHTLWIFASCGGMKSPMGFLAERGLVGSRESAVLNRPTAEEKYRWVESRMRPLPMALAYAVVCEEVGAITAAVKLGIRRDDAVSELGAALDSIGLLFEQMDSAAEEILKARNQELEGVVKPKYRGAMVSWSAPHDAGSWEALA